MQFITAFLLILVIGNSLISIFSFVCYNLKLLPYQALQLGGLDYYAYYYNPLLGYINPREFDFGMIGRPSAFMLEPSYLSWFLTTNYFLVDSYVKNDRWKALLIKPLVFAGAICTFSTGALIVFGVILTMEAFKMGLKKMSFKKNSINKIGRILLVLGFVFYLFVPKEKIYESTANTSYGDRDARMQVSLLILATSSVKELLIGKAPAYIENNSDKGESNQFIKILVEEGIVFSILIIGFVIFCTKNNDNYMLATLLFLNSVVILWTPLFLLNILVCKFASGENAGETSELRLAQTGYS